MDPRREVGGGAAIGVPEADPIRRYVRESIRADAALKEADLMDVAERLRHALAAHGVRVNDSVALAVARELGKV